MKSPEFYEWRTIYQFAKSVGDHERKLELKRQGVVAFYEEVAELAERHTISLLEAKELRMDVRFARWGSPHFKMYPAIAHMLCNTSMNLPTDTLRLPFEMMYVRLPKNAGLPNELESALATTAKTSNGNNGLLIVWKDQTDKKLASSSIVHLDLDAFNTIEESVLNVIANSQLSGNPPESINAIVRVVVGACFFGIGQHEIILPDVPRKHIDKWCEAKRKNDVPTLNRLEKKTDGFTVGREIDLPKATMAIRGERTSGGGIEFAHSHLRRGHMRWQVCGKKNKDRKLIFVPPTVIRPDLPARPQGYRVCEPM